MEKVYIVYEINYGDLLAECDATNILGVYKDKNEALGYTIDYVEMEIKDTNYVLDNERNDIKRDNYVRCFYNNQENWNDYFEVYVEEMEVK